jgi:hypothetical protein
MAPAQLSRAGDFLLRLWDGRPYVFIGTADPTSLLSRWPAAPAVEWVGSTSNRKFRVWMRDLLGVSDDLEG